MNAAPNTPPSLPLLPVQCHVTATTLVLKGRAKDMRLRNHLQELRPDISQAALGHLIPFSRVCCMHFCFVPAGGGGQKGFSVHSLVYVCFVCLAACWLLDRNRVCL